MISTRIISKIEEVPSNWIFEYYLNLSEKLVGQSIVIKSIFNVKDSRPSMHINPNRKTNAYSFNDFSTGRAGYGAHLVAEIFKIDMAGAMIKIVDDYNDFVYKNPGGYCVSEFKEQSKYKVIELSTRGWNTYDDKYWTPFGISSSTLEKFNVKGLKSYMMSNGENEFEVSKQHTYGYFRSDGTLYKIYQPKNPDKKFVKLANYIQGTDQLNPKLNKYLLIGSSLKDIMCIDEMNIGLDLVAADSENSIIRADVIQAYRHKYKGICVLFDNDHAGLMAMAKYKEKYDLPGIHLNLEKDISDSVKKYGLSKVEDILCPLLKNTLTNKVCQEKPISV